MLHVVNTLYCVSVSSKCACAVPTLQVKLSGDGVVFEINIWLFLAFLFIIFQNRKWFLYWFMQKYLPLLEFKCVFVGMINAYSESIRCRGHRHSFWYSANIKHVVNGVLYRIEIQSGREHSAIINPQAKTRRSFWVPHAGYSKLYICSPFFRFAVGGVSVVQLLLLYTAFSSYIWYLNTPCVIWYWYSDVMDIQPQF